MGITFSSKMLILLGSRSSPVRQGWLTDPSVALVLGASKIAFGSSRALLKLFLGPLGRLLDDSWATLGLLLNACGWLFIKISTKDCLLIDILTIFHPLLLLGTSIFAIPSNVFEGFAIFARITSKPLSKCLRTSKSTPTGLQNDSRSLPRRSQGGPESSQDRLKRSQHRPKRPYDRPKRSL